jgi:hypothetical protein
MRATVKRMCGGVTQMDDAIDDNINEAILQLITEVRPDEVTEYTSFSCVANQAEYTFSGDISITDCYAVLMVRDETEDWEIKKGDEYEFNRLKQDTSNSATTGNPHRWIRLGNSLILYNKIPDGTNTIGLWYLERSVTMTTSQDFPLNEEWRKPAERLAAAITWTDLNKPQLAQLHASAYREMVALRQNPGGIEDEVPEAQIVPTSNLVM